jgi:hypothetical protein
MVIEVNGGRFAPLAIPAEYQAPLLVDPDGMPAFELSSQFFKAIPRRNPQVGVA